MSHERCENRGKGLVPRLRFPEFREAGEWDKFSLSKISERITDKVGSRKLSTVSITAGHGFVSQAEKFGRDISGQQYKNYIHLKKGQFSYNKGNSKRFPQGCVYQLTEFEEVAAPSTFISFKFNGDFVSEFFKGYFDSNFHGYQLLRFITSGARSDGLLNISPDDFFSIKLPTPKEKEEQQKIADCLSSLDALIAAQVDKIDALKTHKKGLMQQLFPREGETVPRLRFPEFQDSGEWEPREVGEVFNVTRGYVLSMTLVSGTKTEDTPYPVYSSQTKRNGLCGYYGEYLYKDAITWTTDGANAGDVNFREGRFYCTNVCGVLINEDGYANSCTAELINSVAKNHVSYVGNPKLMNGVMSRIVVPFPSLDEQQKIADCLSSLDTLIAAHMEKLDSLKAHKKGLMQQLFPNPGAVRV